MGSEMCIRDSIYRISGSGGRWTGDIFPEKCGDRFFYGHTAGISGGHDEQL